MANTNAPFGLRYLGPTGGATTMEQVTVPIAYNASAIYTGDPVMYLSTGYVAKWSATTAVSQLAGVFVGCQYLSSSQGKVVRNNYWPGSDVASTQSVTGFIVPINLASPTLWLIQSDSTGVALADLNANIDVNMGTGSTVTGQSGAYLDTGTINTTATLPFRIRGFWGSGIGGRGNVGPGSESGAYNWVIVSANFAGSTGI